MFAKSIYFVLLFFLYCYFNKLLQTVAWNNMNLLFYSVWHCFHRVKVNTLVAMHSFLEALRKNLFPSPFLLLKDTHTFLCSFPSSSNPQSKQCCISLGFSSNATVPLSLPISSTLKDPFNYTGPTWIIQNNLLFFKGQFIISNLNSSFTCNLSQVPGIRKWISLKGPLLYLPQ